MHVVSQPAELSQYEGCAFVPTMGALHEGHLSLIREAKQQSLPVVVSIFVNPEQFAPNEDFDKYPRNLEQDIDFAQEAGADVIFAPEVGVIYPEEPPEIALPRIATEPELEDACRPTHFRGVCLVVARLFDLVQPACAIFGEKDYQQFLVIKHLVKNEGARWNDLQVVGAPIIRDQDGLALSSRNRYLSTDARSQALAIHRALEEPSEQRMIEMLDQHGLEVEYAVIRDADTLREPTSDKPRRVLIAASVDGIRLIDNGVLERT
ncbi:MAG: pantoate--beta-alanine ligase [Phycisphaerales bacterium]|jgi:pantoate--beta-alanine ligase|nr:pantoate--beta-alanine ligase [Phycisphaerales bacterium]